ncbi:VanW family protein [Sphaerisporangium sp. TRM90804]|uniref:VanW family protein n=1 Tax=Sphaerisporangium sp. TRM90804 TaxID=3031113 RepID=UPI00244D6340|nr:VanW family protein [Sphaerisporangium sp. TRM90804]MDH2427640.1 VanW family protein [Sphaerisporangium sp. TRM90804]
MTASVRRSGDPRESSPSVVIAPEPAEESGGRLRLPLAVLGGIFLIFLLVYGIPATYMWGRVLPGTHVSDVQIGGLSETDAIDRVRERFEGHDEESVALTLGGRRVAVVDPREAGLTIDVQATIDDAHTGFPSPVAVWQALTGERDLAPRVSLNATKLDQRIRKVAATVDRPAREGSIVYEGTTPKIVVPRDGALLDRRGTGEAIKRAFLDPPASVALPVVRVRPKTPQAAFTGSLATARRAVSAPITLVNGDRRARLSPSLIAANLTFTPDQDGTVRPRFDAAKAVAGLETTLVGVAEAPRDAGFSIVDGAPRLVHARSGKGVNTDQLAAAVVRVVTEGGGRTIPVSLAVTAPALGDQDVQGLGITETIGEFTSHYPCCAPRVTNIHKAADLVDGRLVKPGETFSLNEVVGEPSAGRGFVQAQMIQDDHLVVGMGGGISQLATTMYNAVFIAGLEEVERTPHRFHVSRYPVGLDAAVSYPELDLRWRNNSDNGVLVKAAYTSTSVTVTLWGTREYDRVALETSGRTDITQPETRTESGADCIPMDGAVGFTVTVTRAFFKNAELVKRDRPVTTVYDPEPRLLCQPRGRDSGGESTENGRPPTDDAVPPALPQRPTDGDRGRDKKPKSQGKPDKKPKLNSKL